MQLLLTSLKSTMILWSEAQLGISLVWFPGITFNGILFGYWLKRLNKHFGLLIFNLILIHVNSMLWKFYFISSYLKPSNTHSAKYYKTGLSRWEEAFICGTSGSSLPPGCEHICSVIYRLYMRQQLLNWDQQYWLHMKESVNFTIWSRFDIICLCNKSRVVCTSLVGDKGKAIIFRGLLTRPLRSDKSIRSGISLDYTTISWMISGS